MQNSSKDLAVFDVCETLYYSNTTHDFVKFVFDKENLRIKRLLFKLINHKLSPFRYSLVAIYILFKFDLHKKVNIYLLRGMSRNQIRKLSDEFVVRILENKKINQTHSMMRKYKNEGCRIILCSSSIEPIINSIAENLDIKDRIYTPLIFEDDIFTGKFSDAVVSRKIKALNEKDISGNIKYAVSDNVTDINLLLSAQSAVAVIHKGKHLNFWNKYPVKILNLNL